MHIKKHFKIIPRTITPQFSDPEITSSEFLPGTVFWINDPGPPGSWPFLGTQVTSTGTKNPQPRTTNIGGAFNTRYTISVQSGQEYLEHS